MRTHSFVGRALAALTMVAVLVGVVVLIRALTSEPGSQPPRRQDIPACRAEDGGPFPCVWDKATMGNGGPYQGERFVIIWRDDTPADHGR